MASTGSSLPADHSFCEASCTVPGMQAALGCISCATVSSSLANQHQISRALGVQCSLQLLAWYTSWLDFHHQFEITHKRYVPTACQDLLSCSLLHRFLVISQLQGCKKAPSSAAPLREMKSLLVNEVTQQEGVPEGSKCLQHPV